MPQGAIVVNNHRFDCSAGSGNHVTLANGNCAAADLTKKGASFDALGGNQNNAVRVTTYDAREICHVRWPKEKPLPGPVVKSENCTSGKIGKESTR
jgi:hypothetical protein